MDTTTHTAIMYFTLALGFLTAVGTSVSLFLHWLAPRTRSTLDDRAVGKLDELLAFLRGLAPQAISIASPISPTNATITSPQTPSAKAAQAGGAAALLIAALAGIGLVAAPALLTGCATLRASSAVAITSFVDCEDPALAKTAADLEPLARAVVSKWIGGSNAPIDTKGLKGDLAGIKDHAQQCAITAAIDAIATQASKPAAAPGAPSSLQARATASTANTGEQMRAAFTGARIELGWAPVHLAGGKVL